MKYEEFTLKELEKLTGEYIILHRNCGGSSEFDSSINHISRAIVEKFHEKYGQCFLGTFYDYNSQEKGEKSIFTEYTGQKILNFEYNFVIPHHDEELAGLITENRNICDQHIYTRIEAITSKVQEIGGFHLFWA